jgi:hypothetical protein
MSNNVIYDGPVGTIDLKMNVTIECEVNYTYLVDGEIPGSANCYLGTSPHSGTLTIDYHIEHPVLLSLIGHTSIPLPSHGEELLNDSKSITIPLDSNGTIEVVIHGKLLGNLTVDSDSRAETTLEWSDWDIKNISIITNAPSELLANTEFIASFTLITSITGSDPVTIDSSQKQVLGNPYEFVVPEFSSFLVLSFFTMATLLAIIVYRKKPAKLHNNTRFNMV